jgi:hypothetical protein
VNHRAVHAASLVATAGSLAAFGVTWRRLRQARRWLASDRERFLEQTKRVKRERGELRKQLKEARDRIGKLERRLDRAPKRHVAREVEIIREYGCTKGASFLTSDAAESYLRHRSPTKMRPYRCAVCRTSGGEVIYHVGHVNKADRHTRALRLAEEA